MSLDPDRFSFFQTVTHGFAPSEQYPDGDLVLYCCTDFAAGVGQSIDSSLRNISAWFARIDARPSAKASLHPAAELVGRKG